MNDLLVIVPSRGRPESVEPLWTDFFGNGTGMADLMFATDDDQPEYPKMPNVLYRRGPRLRMCGTLNAAAVENADKYKYLGFLGDDHRPRTYAWDRIVIDALETHNVVYGNDLLQGENLPTAVFLRSEIVQKLGYMAPPALVHLYLDNFWLCIGRHTSIKYLPDVIIEHLHPAAGKAEWSDSYREVNDQSLYQKDHAAYEEYLLTQFDKDLEKLRG
jgi:hypothetical protein